MITITNTLTGQKELFKPTKKGHVTLYVCGITPYDYAHIGHGRVYVTFDVLSRLLTFLGYNVAYCRNFTDIDDKLLDRAEKELGSPDQYPIIANRFIESFHINMKQLNCIAPTYEPRVTGTIKEIIAFVEKLIDRKKAYVVDGDVYFSIEQFPGYGKLSKQKLEDLRAGARVEVNEKKRDPLDFALWKSEAEGTFWKSPWGYGRPGWAIECSAMADKVLGHPVDIHGGGMDLIFPHHENEIAQSEGLYDAIFVNYWMHIAFVRIDKEKMSKSLGNFFTLDDVFKQYDPMVIRFMYINHHYRSPLDFAWEDVEVMQKTYQRLCTFFASKSDTTISVEQVKQSAIVKQMLEFISDDLNTPGMFGVIFESLKLLEQNNQEFSAVKYFVQHILGLSLQPLPERTVEITPEIQSLLNEREQARLAKDWKRADALREQLRTLGVDVRDKKT